MSTRGVQFFLEGIDKMGEVCYIDGKPPYYKNCFGAKFFIFLQGGMMYEKIEKDVFAIAFFHGSAGLALFRLYACNEQQ